MEAKQSHMLVSRVLHQDDDFITIEVGKRDDVVFHLQQNEEGETVGGDEFLTVAFMHDVGGGRVRSWLPWRN